MGYHGMRSVLVLEFHVQLNEDEVVQVEGMVCVGVPHFRRRRRHGGPRPCVMHGLRASGIERQASGVV